MKLYVDCFTAKSGKHCVALVLADENIRKIVTFDLTICSLVTGIDIHTLCTTQGVYDAII